MATAVKRKRGKSSPSANENSPAASNPLISDAKLKQLYSTMLQCRLLDERAHSLRAVRPTPASRLGVEAAIVGAALDLRRDDWLLPVQDDLLGKFVKGMPLASILSGPIQRKTSRTTATPHASNLTTDYLPFHILPSAAKPAAQLNLASGVALALHAENTGNVVMAFCGDASDSGQRWQEALRFAGKFCLPLIVLTHSKTLARTGPAKKKPVVSLLSEGSVCEFPVIPVDAADVVAMYRVASESIHKARHGGGPTLIQAISLPASPDGRKGSNKQPDAIARMETYLAAKGLFSSSWKQELSNNFRRNLDSALKAGKNPSTRNRE
jgi:pyruvate dehydrogenase E1 component alpha subunit